MLLAVTADTWIVTGLGFGIVLALLVCLVFILMLFGYIMQKATAPKAPKQEKPAPSAPIQPGTPRPSSEPDAPKPASPADDIAAVAYALYLAHKNDKHDIPTAMINAQARETAWNTKSYGLNNIGF